MRNILLAAGLVVGFLPSCADQAGTAEATAPPSQSSAVAPAPAHGHAAHEKHDKDGHGMQGMHDGMGMSCPMKVEGTAVRAEDVEGGATLVFTTTGDVAELRKRVHAHAEKMASGGCPMMKQSAAAP